jgi:hypothetical protein
VHFVITKSRKGLVGEVDSASSGDVRARRRESSFGGRNILVALKWLCRCVVARFQEVKLSRLVAFEEVKMCCRAFGSCCCHSSQVALMSEFVGVMDRRCGMVIACRFRR